MEVLGIIFLAMAIEGFVEYILSNKDASQPWLKYVSLALGVIVAFAYRVDIPAMAGLTAVVPWVNYIISGIIIGRGGNYVNDVLSWFREKPIA